MLLRLPFDDFKGLPWDFGCYTILRAREFLAIRTVTDGRAGVVGGIQVDFIANCAAIAPTGVNHCSDS